jgi:flagellar biosynthetic protein FlhB
MTRQEIIEEHKQSEGDPHIRAKRRSLSRERARKRLAASVTRATLVVTNPTHYAVALRYVAGEQSAPVVVAKGRDRVALRIRALAEAREIMVFEQPELARALYARAQIDEAIPPDFYRAVASLVSYLLSRAGPKS